MHLPTRFVAHSLNIWVCLYVVWICWSSLICIYISELYLCVHLPSPILCSLSFVFCWVIYHQWLCWVVVLSGFIVFRIVECVGLLNVFGCWMFSVVECVGLKDVWRQFDLLNVLNLFKQQRDVLNTTNVVHISFSTMSWWILWTLGGNADCLLYLQ